jgi:hypothetical protein
VTVLPSKSYYIRVYGNTYVASNFKMTLRFNIILLTITCCLTSIFSCDQPSDKKGIVKNESLISIQYDTSNTTIIPFDPEGGSPFDNSYKSTVLSQSDLKSIDSLLNACLANYNKRFEKDHKELTIDYKKYNYRKQVIVVANKNGEKEVWLNCFCKSRGSDKWKTEIISVDDGGKCYFNLKINLTTQKFYELVVNGYA